MTNLQSICLSIWLLAAEVAVTCGAQAEPLNVGEKIEFDTPRADGAKEYNKGMAGGK